MFSLQIQNLASDEHGAAAGGCQLPHVIPDGIAFRIVHLGDYGKSLRQQRVSRQDGDAFSEGLVAGGFPTAQIVVVHGWQVVMDEGIRMHHFHGAGGNQGVHCQSSAGLRRRQAKDGAHSFPPRKYAVAHGFVDGFGAFVLCWQQSVQRCVNQGALFCDVVVQ